MVSSSRNLVDPADSLAAPDFSGLRPSYSSRYPRLLQESASDAKPVPGASVPAKDSPEGEWEDVHGLGITIAREDIVDPDALGRIYAANASGDEIDVIQEDRDAGPQAARSPDIEEDSDPDAWGDEWALDRSGWMKNLGGMDDEGRAQALEDRGQRKHREQALARGKWMWGRSWHENLSAAGRTYLDEWWEERLRGEEQEQARMQAYDDYLKELLRHEIGLEKRRLPGTDGEGEGEGIGRPARRAESLEEDTPARKGEHAGAGHEGVEAVERQLRCGAHGRRTVEAEAR
jgi:hypothetical protein